MKERLYPEPSTALYAKSTIPSTRESQIYFLLTLETDVRVKLAADIPECYYQPTRDKLN